MVSRYASPRFISFSLCPDRAAPQVVDAACAMPSLIMGEKLEVSKDMDTETRRVPLGVGAAICPYAAFFAASLAPQPRTH